MSPPAAPIKPSSPSILAQINEAKSQIGRTQQLWLITLGVGILTLAAGITAIQLPWQEKRRQLTSRYSEEKERSELLAAIQRQKAELQGMEEEFLLQGGATGLTAQISDLAVQSSLQIDSVTPQPELMVEPYTRSQIEILATGRLADVLRFLRTLEEHRPLLWVEQMDLGEPPGEFASGSETAGEEEPPPEGKQQQVRFLIGAVARQRNSK